MNYVYFNFYVDDWMNAPSVLEMCYFQKGLYIDMLAYQWKAGKIPADPKRFRKIFNLTNHKYEVKAVKIFENFELKEGHYRNKKLQKMRRSYEKISKQNSKNSKSTKKKNLQEPTNAERPKTKPKPKPKPKPQKQRITHTWRTR